MNEDILFSVCMIMYVIYNIWYTIKLQKSNDKLRDEISDLMTENDILRSNDMFKDI